MLPPAFPFTERPDWEEGAFQLSTAHFMSLCMKLVYEQEELIEVRGACTAQVMGSMGVPWQYPASDKQHSG